MERVGMDSICILRGEEEDIHRNPNREQELNVLLEWHGVSQDEEPERRFGLEMDVAESREHWTFHFLQEQLQRPHCLRDRYSHWERYDYRLSRQQPRLMEEQLA